MILLELEVPGYHWTMCAWCIISPVGLNAEVENKCTHSTRKTESGRTPLRVRV